MENLGSLTNDQNAALIFAFLQVDSRDLGYDAELLSISKDFNLAWDAKLNESRIQCAEDGDLECDGHLPTHITFSLDLQPAVELQWPYDHAEAAALQEVAEELRNIAAQIENAVMARAIDNLNSNISSSPSEHWKCHLANEVAWAMRQGLGLDHLPQERVIMAFTLTLVKGVCECAPRLLRNLFSAALQYISPANSVCRVTSEDQVPGMDGDQNVVLKTGQ
ncbi:BH3 interacting domain death agonist [Gouania willdenowi]|uniref:BH3-interacting domain death agonist n=1 Tax=Gouania willdenowi TaxID=441366 RepID=A0A8C5EXD2_GOUWI|nr:uncharacterized protein LOC114465589 [Gouania willdenowi]XP_028306492.1 uncharacterized protein LOC114465589 [Gouania willdenowi]